MCNMNLSLAPFGWIISSHVHRYQTKLLPLAAEFLRPSQLPPNPQISPLRPLPRPLQLLESRHTVVVMPSVRVPARFVAHYKDLGD